VEGILHLQRNTGRRRLQTHLLGDNHLQVHHQRRCRASVETLAAMVSCPLDLAPIHVPPPLPSSSISLSSCKPRPPAGRQIPTKPRCGGDPPSPTPLLASAPALPSLYRSAVASGRQGRSQVDGEGVEAVGGAGGGRRAGEENEGIGERGEQTRIGAGFVLSQAAVMRDPLKTYPRRLISGPGLM
jgi:hypothetical protein